MTPTNSMLIEPQLIHIPAGSYQVGVGRQQVERLAQRSPEGRKWL